jgi:hypothetical protein
LFSALALGLGLPVVDEYFRTGLVLRFPTAILAAAMQIVAFVCLTCGLILDSVAQCRQEARRLVYLQIPPPGPDASFRISPPVVPVPAVAD